MSNEAQEKICADNKTINVEINIEEKRIHSEKELAKKEKELKAKEMMLLKYKI